MPKPKTGGKPNLAVVVAVVLLVAAVVAVGVYYFHAKQRGEEVAKLVSEAIDKRDLLEDPSAALVLLKQAQKLEPKNWTVLLEKGRTAIQLDQISASITALEAALANAPQSAHGEIYLELGQAYRLKHKGSSKRKDYQLAIGSFNQALLDPAYEASALFHLGMLRIFNRDFEQAYVDLEELLDKYPDFEHKEQVEEALKLAQRMTQS